MEFAEVCLCLCYNKLLKREQMADNEMKTSVVMQQNSYSSECKYLFKVGKKHSQCEN